jgi:DNA replication protein DnaC
MLDRELLSTLSELKLPAMAETLRLQINDPASIHEPFEVRLGKLLEAEKVARSMGRAIRFERSANLEAGDLADIDWKAKRSGLRKDVVGSLRSLQWVRSGHHLVITGPTGIGKTFLASAFGREATRLGLTVGFWRVRELLNTIDAIAQEQDPTEFRKRVIKPDLLVLDTWLAAPLTAAQTHELEGIVDARYRTRRSMLLASAVPTEEWLPRFGDATNGEALVDRLLNAITLKLGGPSMRGRYS